VKSGALEAMRASLTLTNVPGRKTKPRILMVFITRPSVRDNSAMSAAILLSFCALRFEAYVQVSERTLQILSNVPTKLISFCKRLSRA
jgi:hypothetical protein